MTTWESTDNMDNVTITSDAAYERVTSDEHFEEERNWGYLQQNTSWLVQEVPNISFLDVADTMLESQKTLYKRENWILRVGKAWRSIEVQPQDVVKLTLDENYNISQWHHVVEFDNKESSLNFTVCKPEQTWNIYSIKILQSWYYIISYWYELWTTSATDIRVTIVGTESWIIMSDRHKDTTLPEIMSWWKYVPNVYLVAWDVISMYLDADYTTTVYKSTYLSIQFQQYTLWYSNI